MHADQAPASGFRRVSSALSKFAFPLPSNKQCALPLPFVTAAGVRALVPHGEAVAAVRVEVAEEIDVRSGREERVEERQFL